MRPRSLYPDLTIPLTLATAFEALAKIGDRIGASQETLAALRSTALDAMRVALRGDDGGSPSKETILAADIRFHLKLFPKLAEKAASEKGHLKPSDHAGRADRFVEMLTGKRASSPNCIWPLPDAWRPLADADGSGSATSVYGFLSRCCVWLGHGDAPAVLPSYDEFVRAGVALGSTADTVATYLSQYRRARERALEQSPELALAVMPRKASWRTAHLGIEDATLAALRAQGAADPELMNPEQQLRVLAPEIAGDADWYFSDGPGRALSDCWRQNCWGALQMIGGWLVRAGYTEEMATMSLLDFFERGVADAARAAVNPRAARAAASAGSRAGHRTVSLLEHLAEREARASMRRSPIISARDKSDETVVWFTQGVYTKCSRIWSMVEGVFRDYEHTEPERWALIKARWDALQRRLVDNQIPANRRVNAKDKERLIRTVTLPQLVCVALPMRRREVHRLRSAWTAARAVTAAKGHEMPGEHPVVIAARDAYFARLVPYMALCLALDDGLRRQQYTRGRMGYQVNLRPLFIRDAAGRAVGVQSMETWWSGDREDPAHLKITEREGTLTRRQGRDVRPGYVPLDLTWDLLTVWRPRELVSAGLVSSLEAYDLEADMSAGTWALFVSSRRNSRPERSRSDLGDMVGRELFECVRAYLRPELPEWDKLGDEWRNLWAIHILRLLNASYWGGIRKDWESATYLTEDTEEALRKSYTIVNRALKDRMGLTKGYWEHPEAYDAWMDRLFWERSAADPLDDPDLPLPPRTRELLAAAGTLAHSTVPGGARRPRVRRARPGQAPPKRRSKARAD